MSPIITKVLLSVAAIAAIFGVSYNLSDKNSCDANDFECSINGNPKSTWTAQNNDLTKKSASELKHLTGAVLGRNNLPRTNWTAEEVAAIPDTFDVADKWGQCNSVIFLRDQSDCGSCWAVAAEDAASDRLCIESVKKGGAIDQTRLSSRDLLSCCTSCGDGCNGGGPAQAYEYLVNNGLVTGGPYHDQHKDVCQAYPFPRCAHHVKPPAGMKSCDDLNGGNEFQTPKCMHNTCDSGKNTYNGRWHTDRAIGVTGEDQLKAEIYHNGSVEVAYTVYKDFMAYKSGVYKYDGVSPALGGHAVVMVGWGTTSEGVKYWKIKNNWNQYWGEQGYFRILRGVNECGIESEGVAGVNFHFVAADATTA